MSGLRRIVGSLSIDGPAAVADLAQRLGMPRTTVSEYAAQLRRAGRIHICKWQNAQRPIYAAGEGRDKPRPAARTKAQRNRKLYLTIKADPVKLLNKIMGNRAYRARTRTTRPPPQTWLSSLV